MEITEIIKDAAMYPLNHKKELLIVMAIDLIITIFGILGNMNLHSLQTDAANYLLNVADMINLGGAYALTNNGIGEAGLIGIIGLIIAYIISFLLIGYGIDIVKLGIQKDDAVPEINPKGQIINGIKIFIINFIYVIIPTLVMIVLLQVNVILGAIVGLILIISFMFGLLMAQCRLANTGSLGAALNIPEALKDINNVGIVKVLAVSIVLFVLAFILDKILLVIANILGPMGGINFISPILAAICTGYLFFFAYRAIGLMYADNDAYS
ncbi:MAG: DUF4013 domain-containing protein [Methanobrevibacter olleyae]|uniref:DUF4013 domain-containing protein n=1 Tax=Methanobrevibacter olleyae TaxID=294671 RepID=A0A8T3VYP3_METOL|nr:DUF4013 domain-containing protein [Methanobrevibacter olleyae]